MNLYFAAASIRGCIRARIGRRGGGVFDAGHLGDDRCGDLRHVRHHGDGLGVVRVGVDRCLKRRSDPAFYDVGVFHGPFLIRKECAEDEVVGDRAIDRRENADSARRKFGRELRLLKRAHVDAMIRERGAGRRVRDLDPFHRLRVPAVLIDPSLDDELVEIVQGAGRADLPVEVRTGLDRRVGRNEAQVVGDFRIPDRCAADHDERQIAQVRHKRCDEAPFAHFVGAGHHGRRRDRAARRGDELDVQPGLLVHPGLDRVEDRGHVIGRHAGETDGIEGLRSHDLRRDGERCGSRQRSGTCRRSAWADLLGGRPASV